MARQRRELVAGLEPACPQPRGETAGDRPHRVGVHRIPSRTTVPPSWPGGITALTRISPVKEEVIIYRWEERLMKFDLMLKLFPHVRSIADDSVLQGATYSRTMMG